MLFFVNTGNHILCGSEDGNVYMWNTYAKQKHTLYNPPNGTSYSPRSRTGKQNLYDRNKIYEWFEGVSTKNHEMPVITDAHFVPSEQVKSALLASGLFPALKGLDNVDYDFDGSMVVSCDYDGTVRLFLRKNCLDNVIYAAGPEGDHATNLTLKG